MTRILLVSIRRIIRYSICWSKITISDRPDITTCASSNQATMILRLCGPKPFSIHLTYSFSEAFIEREHLSREWQWILRVRKNGNLSFVIRAVWLRRKCNPISECKALLHLIGWCSAIHYDWRHGYCVCSVCSARPILESKVQRSSLSVRRMRIVLLANKRFPGQ